MVPRCLPRTEGVESLLVLSRNGGQVAVNAARKLRKAAKLGNNVFLRAGMPVSTYAETLPVLPGRINAVPQGRCRAEGHCDHLGGRLFPDLQLCEWGLEYDHAR